MQTPDGCNTEDQEENVESCLDDERVSQRKNKGIPPSRLGYKVQTCNIREPSSWNQMLTFSQREKNNWLVAAEQEMNSLIDHGVWSLSNLPPEKKAISCKWVFKAKLNGKGDVDSYKARLVARGFSQKYGEDYDETFAPVVKHETIKVLLTVAAQNSFDVRHLDVKSAYLNGNLEEEIFMEQPHGFVVPGQEDKVLRLHKRIYWT